MNPGRERSKKVFISLTTLMPILNALALLAGDGRYRSDITAGLLMIIVFTCVMVLIWSAIGIALVTAAATVGNIVRPGRSIFPDIWYKVCVGAVLGLVCSPLYLYVVAHLSKILD